MSKNKPQSNIQQGNIHSNITGIRGVNNRNNIQTLIKYLNYRNAPSEYSI